MKKFNDYTTVRFGFENCEYLDMNRNDFKAIIFDDITSSWHSPYNGNGEFRQMIVSNYIKVIIKKQSDKPYYPFGIKDCPTTIFKRLSEGDIVDISLLNKEGEIMKQFYVDYDGQEVNLNQSNRINEWDYFEIKIAGDSYRYAD